jgi:hypothetical protein
MKHVLKGAFLVAILGMVYSCEHSVTDSAGVATSSISAEIHVSYTGSQLVTVETKLRDGPINSDTDINLISGDTLKVSTVGDPSSLNFSDNLFDHLLEVADQVKTMKRGSRYVYDRYISGIWYYTSIDAKYRDKDFTVSLSRDHQNDAPNSVIHLPPEFTISVDETQTNPVLSRSALMTVRWTPANPGYSMKVSGFVNCSNGDNGEWDSGSFTNQAPNPTDYYEIPANTFSGYSGDCIVTMGVENSLLKAADPAFRPGSSIQSHQYRTVAVSTTE